MEAIVKFNLLANLGKSARTDGEAFALWGRTAEQSGLAGEAAQQFCREFAGAAEMHRLGVRALGSGDLSPMLAAVARAKGRRPVREEAARRQHLGAIQARLRNLDLLDE